MSRLFAVMLSAAALAQPAIARQPVSLQPFSADYQVRIDGKETGESRIELKRLGDQAYQHRVYALGTKGLARLARVSADQTADLMLVDGTVRLTHAAMNVHSLIRDREVSVNFDWSNKQARWSGDIDKDKQRVWPLTGTPATGSTLNLQLGLVAWTEPAGARLEYILHERSKAKPVEYTVGAPESIEVPAGRFRAVPLVDTDLRKQRVTTAWYAEGLPPTPVRVLQVEKGEAKYELRLQRIAL